MTAQELLMALWAEFPTPSMLLAGLILAGGVMMLLAGRQLLSILLLALGGSLGYALGSWLGGQLDSNLPLWAPGLVGAVVLGGILVMAQRAIVPAALALTLALVGPIAFAISDAAVAPTMPNDMNATSVSASVPAQEINAPSTAVMMDWPAAGVPHELTTNSTFNTVLDKIQDWWLGLSPASRGGIMITVFVGLVVGLLVGIALPKVTATVMTAAFGSAAILASISWIIMTFRGLDSPPAPDDWIETFGLWMIVTIAGCLLQWALIPSSKSKQPPPAAQATTRQVRRQRMTGGDKPKTA